MLAHAAAALSDASSPHGARARRLLPPSTALSPEMVDWALVTSLREVSRERLLTLLRSAGSPLVNAKPAMPSLASVVLAGNVFTASIRPIFVLLALGVPIVCKASSHDDVFPRLLAEALNQIDAGVGGALGVCAFPGGTIPLEEALFEHADVVVVYGSDETVGALRARVKPTTRLVEHGHGVSVAFVGGAALSGTAAAAAASKRLALDVAAYDQRGCLSPHVAFVQRGGAIGPDEFAESVHRELSALGETLPRGPLPVDIAAAQMQWRGTMAVLGRLHEGRAHAVARLEAGPLRAGPGWRNLLLLDSDGPEDVARQVAPLGVHLKSIGVAGDDGDFQRLADALAPPFSPRLCSLGSMQMPGIESLADGASPLDGLVRWMEIDSRDRRGVARDQ